MRCLLLSLLSFALLAVVVLRQTSAAPRLVGRALAGQATETFLNISKELRKAVTVNEIVKHLAAFQDFADMSEDGSRESSSLGYQLSGDYIINLLNETGAYNVSKHDFFYNTADKLGPSEMMKIVDGKEYGGEEYEENSDFIPMKMSPFGAMSGMTQKVNNQGCDEKDFGSFIPGNIAIIERGECNLSTKAINAEGRGAIGTIIYNYANESVFKGHLGEPVAQYPVFCVSAQVGEELAAGVLLHMFSNTTITARSTFNIVVDAKYGSNDTIVMAGAHLDSVPGVAGINDNGSGSAALLETALQMSKLDIRTENKIRFAWWGAEEYGLIGSKNYILESKADYLSKIALYLNFDMIGSPNFIRGVYNTGDGKAFPGEDKIADVFLEYFDDQDLAVIPLGKLEKGAFRGRSDHGSFQRTANPPIPTGGLFTGSGFQSHQNKTEEQVTTFGGTAGTYFDSCYHQECDNIDNINTQALDDMSEAMAHSIMFFAETNSLREFLNNTQSDGDRRQLVVEAPDDLWYLGEKTSIL